MTTLRDQMNPLIAAVRASVIRTKSELAGDATRPRHPVPFVTIARQPGLERDSFVPKLVDRLSLTRPEQPTWRTFDRELVEKVATDSHISQELIEALGQESYSWVEDLFSGLRVAEGKPLATEFAIYRRVAATIRALAQAGRVVMVGRGGVFITRNIPGGVHLWIVAPLEYRIAEIARQQNINEREAADHLRRLEHNRASFYKRYWPAENLTPEMFTLTLNAARLSEVQRVEAAVAVIQDNPKIAGLQEAV